MENQDEVLGRTISYETYEMFRNRYKITRRKQIHKYVDKTLDDIRQDIYNYEKNHQDEIIHGLYFNVPE